jgi:DNA-binding transcriptional MerR regulator
MFDKKEHRAGITRDEVSERLGVSISTVDRWKRRGVLKVSKKVGKRLYFDSHSIQEIHEFLKLRERVKSGPL